MSIQRWEPFREMVSLRDAMDRLLEESFIRPRGTMTMLGGGMPLDVRETDDAFVVETTVPGARPEDVDISVLGDTLRVHADIKDEGDREGERWLIRERRFGYFERTVTLPTTIKADRANAEFENGVLRITLPKAEEAKPRPIPVRAGASGQGGKPQEIEVESREKK